MIQSEALPLTCFGKEIVVYLDLSSGYINVFTFLMSRRKPLLYRASHDQQVPDLLGERRKGLKPLDNDMHLD